MSAFAICFDLAAPLSVAHLFSFLLFSHLHDRVCKLHDPADQQPREAQVGDHEVGHGTVAAREARQASAAAERARHSETQAVEQHAKGVQLDVLRRKEWCRE